MMISTLSAALTADIDSNSFAIDDHDWYHACWNRNVAVASGTVADEGLPTVTDEFAFSRFGL